MVAPEAETGKELIFQRSLKKVMGDRQGCFLEANKGYWRHLKFLKPYDISSRILLERHDSSRTPSPQHTHRQLGNPAVILNLLSYFQFANIWFSRKSYPYGLLILVLLS